MFSSMGLRSRSWATAHGASTLARRSRRWSPFVVVLLLVAVAGCGSTSDASQQQLDQARREGASQQKIKDQQAQLRRDIEALRKERAASRSSSSSSGSGRPVASTSSATSGGGAAPASAGSCGQGVSAGANTSCAFAINVAKAYFEDGGGSPTLSVFSPVTNQTYTMQCTGGAPTTCRGGNNAVVYIR